ncbi:hypothetical protein CC80DRAFT_490472 [Byssothecium circinans]|uniref:Uncharacterized protein n=1 Tax=Byssothecium circinans TaxID=147558 RepID=A0A6A5U2U2_9PLEO|nr:hypothetical protein CC80DRAFT_490472 [Byssothecium circinans]
MTPHSKTVRGTFSHPKFSSASQPPQLGDHVSLEREKNDSAPSTGTQNSASSANITPGDPYRQRGSQLPHSKSVRGTLANASGPQLNRSMLGDPVSLKAETSDNNFDSGAESGGKEREEMKKAAEKRAEAGRSKL